ncbi:hypothetical protein Tco_0392438 [Tanacetum coccineum]
MSLVATMTQIANSLKWFPKAVSTYNNNQLRTSSNSRTHATVMIVTLFTETIQRKVQKKKTLEEKMDSQYFKDKALLMEAKEKGDVLDAEAEAFIADVECTTPYDQPQALTTTNMFQANNEIWLLLCFLPDSVVPPSSNCLCEDLRSACDREHTKVLELEAEISKQKQANTSLKSTGTLKDYSLPAKSANARRVEAHYRTLNKKNRVDSNLLVKHSASESNLRKTSVLHGSTRKNGNPLRMLGNPLRESGNQLANPLLIASLSGSLLAGISHVLGSYL